MSEPMLLGQTDIFPTFLTPFWLLSVGAAIGLIAVAIALAITFLASNIPGLSNLIDNKQGRMVGGAILGALISTAVIYLLFTSGGPDNGLPSDETARAGQTWQGWLVVGLFLVPACFVAGFSLLAMCSKRAVSEIPIAITEGPLYWLTVICSALSGFAVLGVLLFWVNGFGLFLIVREPLTLLESYPKTFQNTQVRYNFDIDKLEDRDEELKFKFDGSEVNTLAIQSGDAVWLAFEPMNIDLPADQIVRIPKRRENDWILLSKANDSTKVIPDRAIDTLYVRNVGDGPTELSVIVDTSPENRETRVITTMAFCVFGVYMVYFAFRALMPKVSAVALSTFKTEIAQSLFMLTVIIGLTFMLVSVYIPYNTFGEDIKMLKDSGLTVILVSGIFLAVWAASKSVADEIEGRTALTVLSKPIGRRQFLLGKFLGIAWAVGLLFVVLSLGFLVAVSYKPIYDARESALGDVIWQTCYIETMRIIPGLVLAYMETLVFVAISIAISTRLSLMANFPICLAIYVLGHLTPLMVQSSVAVEAFEAVVFFGQLIATVVPVLDHFNIQAAVAAGTDVPAPYLGYCLIYCLIYGAIAMLLALVLFEDRDLA